MTAANPNQEPVNWEQIPQSVAEYERLTGSAYHSRLADNDPARPSYYQQDNSFPQHLPFPKAAERKVFRHVDPGAREKHRRIIAGQIIDMYGEQIVTEIMAATTDGVFTPETVFTHRMPKVWVKGASSGTTIVRPEILTIPEVLEEEPVPIPRWRRKYFLRTAAAAGVVAALGVGMLPIWGSVPQDPAPRYVTK